MKQKQAASNKENATEHPDESKGKAKNHQIKKIKRSSSRRQEEPPETKADEAQESGRWSTIKKPECRRQRPSRLPLD